MMEPYVAPFVSAVLMAVGLYFLSLASEKEVMLIHHVSDKSEKYLMRMSKLWRTVASAITTLATMNLAGFLLTVLSLKIATASFLFIMFYYLSARATHALTDAKLYDLAGLPDQ